MQLELRTIYLTVFNQQYCIEQDAIKQYRWWDTNDVLTLLGPKIQSGFWKLSKVKYIFSMNGRLNFRELPKTRLNLGSQQRQDIICVPPSVLFNCICLEGTMSSVRNIWWKRHGQPSRPHNPLLATQPFPSSHFVIISNNTIAGRLPENSRNSFVDLQ